MTVDTEAIFALVNEYGLSRDAFEELTGSMATAWFDERLHDTLFIARGVGRPLWLGEGKHEAFVASTKDALEVTERYLGLKLKKASWLHSRTASAARPLGSTPIALSKRSRCLPCARRTRERRASGAWL